MDLNQWAAEKVMGWNEKQIGYEWVWLTGGTYDRGDGYQIQRNINQKDFDPLTDKNHLFMVVEKMRELGWCGKVTWWDKSWTVRNSIYGAEFFRFNPDINGPQIQDDNLNLAILTAAKKSLEVSHE